MDRARTSTVAVIALSAMLSVVAGNPETTNLISVFMITCSDGSVCPSNATEATLAKATGREVAEECCVYFTGGCCTAAENQQLVMWFYVALGLGIGVPLLIAIVLAALICGCIYYKLRYASPPESRVEKDIFMSPATRSYSYWNTYANGSTEKAIFHPDS